MKDKEYLKANGFNVELALESLNDLDMYNEILYDFISDNKEEKLTENIKNKDIKKYILFVHNLKSECSYLGIEKLASMATIHQEKAENHDYEYIQNNIEELINEIKKVNKVAKTYLSK